MNRAIAAAALIALVAAFLVLALTPAAAADVVDFSFVIQGDTVRFEDRSTTDNGTIVLRTWDFGDGANETRTDNATSHRYAETSRTYRVNLTVTIERTDGVFVRLSTAKDVAFPGPFGGICCGLVVAPLALVGLVHVAGKRKRSEVTGVRRKRAKRRRRGR